MKRNLRKLRQERGVSQLRLAHLSGVGRFRIYLAENGLTTLRPQELQRIRKALAIYKPTEVCDE